MNGVRGWALQFDERSCLYCCRSIQRAAGVSSLPVANLQGLGRGRGGTANTNMRADVATSNGVNKHTPGSQQRCSWRTAASASGGVGRAATLTSRSVVVLLVKPPEHGLTRLRIVQQRSGSHAGGDNLCIMLHSYSAGAPARGSHRAKQRAVVDDEDTRSPYGVCGGTAAGHGEQIG